MEKKNTKSKKDFWSILKRFLIVLYFLITVPLCGILIYSFSEDYYRSHSKRYFFSATNPEKEIAGLLRVGYSSVPEDRSEIIAKNDKDIIEHFLSHNPESETEFKKFMNGEKKTSWALAKDLLGNPSDFGLEQKRYVGIYLFYMILIDLLIILGYIVITDILLKTGSYILNGKFEGGFNYKKLFVALKNKTLEKK